jgi:hypothetical protein
MSTPYRSRALRRLVVRAALLACAVGCSSPRGRSADDAGPSEDGPAGGPPAPVVADGPPPAGAGPVGLPLAGFGELPALAPHIGTSDDLLAVELARDLRRGGDAVRLIAEAALASGFFIEKADGSLLIPPSPIKPSALFQSWEIQLIARLYQNGMTVPLSDFAKLATKAFGDGPVDVPALLVQSLGDSLGAEGPLRFWARFIDEVGPRSPMGETLLSDPALDISAARLDGVQLAFLTRRLVAEAHSFAGPVSTPRLAKRAGGCQLNESGQLILDWAAALFGLGYAGLLEAISENVPAAEKFARFTGMANVVLAYLKLAYLKAVLTMTLSPSVSPLQRTRSTRSPGESTLFTFTARFDIGSNADWANCFRTLLNAGGLDFDLPPDGAIAGGEVNWSIVAGHTTGRGLGIIQFGSGAQVFRGRTDAQGVAKATVDGMKQPRELPEIAEVVVKTGAVTVNVAYEPRDLWKDLADAIGTAAAGPAGLLTLPIDIGARNGWLFAAYHSFPVLDWHAGYTLRMTLDYESRAGSPGDELNVSHQDVWTGNLVAREPDFPDDAIYEGLFTAKSRGTLQANTGGLTCDAEWDGEQAFYVRGHETAEGLLLSSVEIDRPVYSRSRETGALCGKHQWRHLPTGASHFQGRVAPPLQLPSTWTERKTQVISHPSPPAGVLQQTYTAVWGPAPR